MHFSLDFNTILQVVMSAGIIGIFKQLWNMNGSMREMKVWQGMHEEEDQRRFDALENRRH